MKLTGTPKTKNDEYNALFNTWKTSQKPEHMVQLLDAVNPILDKAVTTFTGSSSVIMKSKAKSLAIDAFKRYDPEKSQMNTFLFNQLQPLRRFATKQNVSYAPEKSYSQAQQLLDLERSLTDSLGYEPSDSELADKSGFSVTKIRKLRKYVRPSVSWGAFVNEEGENYLPAEYNNKENLILEFVYNDLHPTKQKIMDWKMGLHGKKPLSNTEIAAKLKLSPGRVSQMSNQIADELARATNVI